jgi:hypothetical protein
MTSRLRSAIVAGALVAPAATAEVYLSPSWNARVDPAPVVIVLPATIEMRVEGYNHTSLHRDETASLELRYAEYVSRAIRASGWSPSQEVLDTDRLTEDKELRYLLAYLRERHATLAQRILRSPRDMRAGQVSFRRPLTELTRHSGASLLVFVHVEGLHYTTARKVLRLARGIAFALTDPVMFDDSMKLRVSIVDAATGDFLAFLRPKQTGESGFRKEFQKLLSARR